MPVPPMTHVETAHELGVGHQRHTQFAGLVALALFGLGLVADHQRGFRVDGVGVGQPGVQDPLDELLVGARDLGRQRDPHALHQRAAADDTGPG